MILFFSANTEMVRRQNREIFRRAEDLPEGLQFKSLDDFATFNDSNAEAFDNLVCINFSANNCKHVCYSIFLLTIVI